MRNREIRDVRFRYYENGFDIVAAAGGISYASFHGITNLYF